jgi:hypothetical protein
MGGAEARLKAAEDYGLSPFAKLVGNLDPAEDFISHAGYGDDGGIGIEVNIVEVLEAGLSFPTGRDDRAQGRKGEGNGVKASSF